MEVPFRFRFNLWLVFLLFWLCIVSIGQSNADDSEFKLVQGRDLLVFFGFDEEIQPNISSSTPLSIPVVSELMQGQDIQRASGVDGRKSSALFVSGTTWVRFHVDLGHRSQLTLGAWVKLASIREAVVLYDAGYSRGIRFVRDGDDSDVNGYFWQAFWGENRVSAGVSAKLNQWVFLAAAFSEEEIVLQVDRTLYTASVELHVDKLYGETFVDVAKNLYGSIDSLFIYATALPKSQLVELYDRERVKQASIPYALSSAGYAVSFEAGNDGRATGYGTIENIDLPVTLYQGSLAMWLRPGYHTTEMTVLSVGESSLSVGLKALRRIDLAGCAKDQRLRLELRRAAYSFRVVAHLCYVEHHACGHLYQWHTRWDKHAAFFSSSYIDTWGNSSSRPRVRGN